MMSPDLQRIKHIRDYCIAISDTIKRYGHSFETYASDADYQRSVSFSILQIGELSAGLTAEYKQLTVNRVQWGPMKAMRNLVAQNYGKMDQSIIWETATVDIPALLQFCNEQLAEYYLNFFRASPLAWARSVSRKKVLSSHTDSKKPAYRSA